jgi:hypothetical protein
MQLVAEASRVIGKGKGAWSETQNMRKGICSNLVSSFAERMLSFFGATWKNETSLQTWYHHNLYATQNQYSTVKRMVYNRTSG